MVSQADHCALCGGRLTLAIPGEDGAVYCCHACKEVAVLLAEHPLPGPAAVENGNAERTTLDLGGMWCASCGWLIEERLRRTPGVSTASVSFLERKARIEFNGSVVSEAHLRRKIRSLGYRADSSADPGEEEERFFTRMLTGGLLAMHIMVVSLIIYARDWFGLSSPDSAWLEQFFYTMQFVLSIPLFLLLGLPIVRAGIAGLLRGLPNVQTLVALGTAAALGLSARNLFAMAGHVYFDTAAMLFFLLTVGRWLEMKAHLTGQSALETMAGSVPLQARLLDGGVEISTPVTALRPGQRIRVLAGETVPVDGVVATGEGAIDERSLTGEPAPVLRTQNDSLFAGTIAVDGAFEMIVSRIGADTRLGQVRRLLDDLVWERTPAEKLADRLAARLVFAAIIIAALTFTGYWINSGPEIALLNALSVLLIACPCALGIATPLTLWQAVGLASENGILLRSSVVLEQLAAVNAVLFDKTGTLTDLHYGVSAVHTCNSSESDFLETIGALEALSTHPIGRTLAEAATADEIQATVEAFHSVPGAGVSGKVNGRDVLVGSRRLLVENGLSIPVELEETAAQAEDGGGIVVFGAWDSKVHGLAVVGEQLRPEVHGVLTSLQELGLEVQVLTGDTPEAGLRWAQTLGIPVYAGLMPEEKLSRIRETGHAVMVGDGINDGPALAAAEVGIAMVHGTDAARAAAGVTLTADNLQAVPWLIRLSIETRRRLRQNLVWAGAYNAVGIALAAAGLLQPVLAAVAMVLSSAFVTRNAMRLRRFPALESSGQGQASATIPSNTTSNLENNPSHGKRLPAAPVPPQT